MSWSDDRVETLKRLWAEHKTADEIAAEMQLGRSAVLGKAMRLGLKRKLTGARAVSRVLELVAEEDLSLRRAASLVGMPYTAIDDLWQAYVDRYDFGLPRDPAKDDIMSPARS